MESHKINDNADLVTYEIEGKGCANVITRSEDGARHVGSTAIFEPQGKQSTGDGHVKCIAGIISRADALNRAGQQLQAQSNLNNLAQQYNGYNAILPQNDPKPGMVVRMTADGKGYEWANPADPGALPAKWAEAPSNAVETTENQPIVDIMAITRGMCK